ncbi:Serum response factor-binding protein 1 [Manis javanica]|nr:Serum response factor-binding protein 1 [Manis javanica]
MQSNAQSKMRSVSRLESKKGTGDALLKSQRRARRLLEETPAMKAAKCVETSLGLEAETCRHGTPVVTNPSACQLWNTAWKHREDLLKVVL